jgi:hypothetical protein
MARRAAHEEGIFAGVERLEHHAAVRLTAQLGSATASRRSPWTLA